MRVVYNDEWEKRELQRKAKSDDEDDSKWSLLFYGFDANKRGHIFSIEDKDVTYYDQVGYGAIGSGKDMAEQYLASFPYRQINPFWQAVFSVLAAKFSAEIASDVGKKWTLALVERPQSGFVLQVDQKLIDEIKAKWEQLPKIPDGIEQMMNTVIFSDRLYGATRSASQKSEPEQ